MRLQTYVDLAWWSGWAWLAASVLAGVVILAASLAANDQVDWLKQGRGTALQFVGGGAFFAAIFPAFATRQFRLMSWGALAGATFVYLGTAIILREENPFLLAVIIYITVIPTLMVSSMVLAANLLRDLFE